MRELINRDNENFALIRRTDKPLTSLAIFIHGFRGNYLTTWGSLPNLLHTEADTRPVFEEWDYLFVGYDTGKVETYLDIAQFLWTQWGKASRGEPPFKIKYERLALLGHSLGTLGIRQSLLSHSQQPPNMLTALHGAAYFGSPINGSPLAKLGLGYEIRHALKPNSPQLRMLKAWCRDLHAIKPWRDVRLITGIDDAVVGYKGAELMNWEGDSPHIQTHFDHSALVKPKGWNSTLIDEIQACLQ